MDVPQAIQEIRGGLNLSQERLAHNLGVSFTTVNRWEKGKTTPRKSALKQLEKMLSDVQEIECPSIDVPTPKLNAFSFFSGAGGFHLGIEQANFNVLVSTDIDPYSEKTHKKNWPNKPFILEDIQQLNSKDLLEITYDKKPDLIFAGPPCQGFSTLGDKSSADPRNLLFESFAKIVGELNPRYILIENVKSLVTMYKGQYYEYIINKFNQLGYKMYADILNAADYGVPQIRERVFFFGTKHDAPFNFPLTTHGLDKSLKPYETVEEWIGDLVNKGPEIPNHISLNHSYKVIQRYKLIPEGGKLPPPDELPPEIRRKNFGSTYKRLHRNKPSLTLVPGNNAFPVHPTLDRSLTPREAARLQTFPDSFIFKGDRRRQCILVGNAVPTLLAEQLGNSIIDHCENNSGSRIAAKPVRIIKHLKLSAKFQENQIMPISKLLELPETQGFIDLFSGAGGLSIGFGRAGFRPLLCVDNDKTVENTHRHNLPSTPFLNDDLSLSEVQDVIINRFKGKNIAIIIGGPPCQGFSIFGKRRFINKGYNPKVDARNKLVLSFTNIVEKISPRWFIMENVPGLVSLDNGLFFKYLIHELHKIGYITIEAKILTAADYGVPQLRKRLLIIGNKTGHIIPWPKKKYFLEPKDWQKKFRTVGAVISDLADDKSYSSCTCHVPMKHKPLTVERYNYIPEGGKLNIDALPEYLKKGYKTEEVQNYSHIFKRLHRNEPSITMVPGHNAFPIHPWLNRALTVREAARIQTFPDDLEFMGTRQEQCIQVGNAFPPLLAELIANNIRKTEVNKWYPGKVPKSAYYSVIENSINNSELLVRLSP